MESRNFNCSVRLHRRLAIFPLATLEPIGHLKRWSERMFVSRQLKRSGMIELGPLPREWWNATNGRSVGQTLRPAPSDTQTVAQCSERTHRWTVTVCSL